jgi:outer membrane protein OmpA-like peptidoglycan-associated protein
MIRTHLVAAVAAASFVGLFGCSAHVAVPAVAVAVPEPVVVAPTAPGVVLPPPPRLAAVCDANISPHGHLKFPHEIEFDIGKATIKSTPANNAILQCLGECLANNKLVTRFRLEGYTDNQGDPAGNKVLSQQRADAVVAWMVSHGADGSRMWAKGFGPQYPLAANDTPAHMAENRRVEFHIDQINGAKASDQNLYLAMNPPAPVAVEAVGVPVVAVGVGIPTVAVGVSGVAMGGGVHVGMAAPSVAVGVAVPTGVSVGIGGGAAAPGGKAAGKADSKDKKKKK